MSPTETAVSGTCHPVRATTGSSTSTPTKLVVSVIAIRADSTELHAVLAAESSPDAAASTTPRSGSGAVDTSAPPAEDTRASPSTATNSTADVRGEGRAQWATECAAVRTTGASPRAMSVDVDTPTSRTARKKVSWKPNEPPETASNRPGCRRSSPASRAPVGPSTDSSTAGRADEPPEHDRLRGATAVLQHADHNSDGTPQHTGHGERSCSGGCRARRRERPQPRSRSRGRPVGAKGARRSPGRLDERHPHLIPSPPC